MARENCYIPRRYIFAIMGHLGIFMAYSLRVNLSVALVEMVNSTATHSKQKFDPECNRGRNNSNANINGEFNWNQNQQGLILSSFFYGYLLTQLPGGFLASKYGGKHVFGGGILLTSLLTLLTPIAARTSFSLFIVVRVLLGFCQGVTFPSMHALLAKWVPPADRSKFVGYILGGMYSGTIISLPICGLLAGSKFLGGWPSVFYIFGGLGIVWYAFWLFLVYNSPEEHPYIEDAEKQYIKESQQGCSTSTKKLGVPWRSIFTSVPVWAIAVAHFTNNWVWYMLLTDLPSYFKDVLNFNIKENGFLSAVPYISALFFFNMAGQISDLIRRKCLSTKNTRRIMAACGFFPTVVFLVLSSYAGCSNIAWSVACMVLATGFIGMNGSGFLVNHLDIAPRYGGVLMGISNIPGTLAGCITPSVTGYFINNNPSAERYRIVFFIATAITVIGGLFFIVFVSGTQQKWNEGPPEKEDKKILINNDLNNETANIC